MSIPDLELGPLHNAFAPCLKELDELVNDLKLRAREQQRRDQLLRIIGVAHGRSNEETIQLQEKFAPEREEFEALRNAYRLTMQKVSLTVAQARQCLMDGFPGTEQFLDKFEDLMIRYGNPAVAADALVLRLQALMWRASESVSTSTMAKSVVAVSKAKGVSSAEPPAQSAKRDRAVRAPDVETSRQRITLHNQLRMELATIHADVRKNTTVEKLRAKYPQLSIWQNLCEPEQQELLEGNFTPRAY